MEIPIIVLAAGASARMQGLDKLLQPVDGLPLIARQARMARRVTDGAVIVAVPAGPHPRASAIDGLDVIPCPVPDAAEGMSASLRQAMGALPPEAQAVAVLLADLPDLTDADLYAVLGAVDFSQKNLVWRGATEDGKPGHPVVFHRDLFTKLTGLTGDTGAQEVARAALDQTVLVSLPGNRARADLDTQEDWARWRASNPDRS